MLDSTSNTPAQEEELKLRNVRALRVFIYFLSLLAALALLALLSYLGSWVHFHFHPMLHAPHRAHWPQIFLKQ